MVHGLFSFLLFFYSYVVISIQLVYRDVSLIIFLFGFGLGLWLIV
jgi:hypothetical protein